MHLDRPGGSLNQTGCALDHRFNGFVPFRQVLDVGDRVEDSVGVGIDDHFRLVVDLTHFELPPS